MFEQRMTGKMIIERIKALLKSKIMHSFELIDSHGLVPGITSLNMFLLKRPESLLLAGLAKSLVFKNAFVFTNAACKLQKDVNSMYMERRSFKVE